jgi:hypothetical protein
VSWCTVDPAVLGNGLKPYRASTGNIAETLLPQATINAFKGTRLEFLQIPQMTSVRVLCIQAAWDDGLTSLRLVNTLEFVGKIFPNIEELRGTKGGVPGWLSDLEVTGPWHLSSESHVD